MTATARIADAPSRPKALWLPVSIAKSINDPGKFRVFRHKQGQSSENPKSRLPLRKGEMDIPLRAKVSQEVNDRFMSDLSLLRDESPVHELIDEISHHRTKNGRRFRALDPTGKDRDLLQSICNSDFWNNQCRITSELIEHRFWFGTHRKAIVVKD